jgi:outer membrane scaffolding protein for murein synthesis (MipA/OmpV family)
MKKGLLTLFAAVTFFAASAQINQGAILVGGSSNLAFGSYKPKDGDGITVINLDAKAGYFIIENLALGVNLGYAKFDDLSETSIGAFARYYINGKIFVGAGVNTNKSDDGDTDFSYTSVPLEVGYAAFITDDIAIEPAIMYEMQSGDQEGSAFGVNVGISFYLNKD